MAIYIGFDSSTQGLTAIAIEVDGRRRRVVFQRSLNYDEQFPRYGTTSGVLPRTEPLVATSSPQMWAEALDRLMGIVATESGIDLARVRAISGSAQQHGSVYLNASAQGTLSAFDPGRPLVGQIQGIFARPDSPIWMDSSTSAQCAAITAAVGGERALAQLTGSRAFARFTGPQIRKFYERNPGAYEGTARIHLVSSYMASLLAGKDAPVDPGDGSGMNLMDIATRQWAPIALEATAPGLKARLPAIQPSWAIAGRLSPFWVQRHGFPAARIVSWSGDNPCSLIGVGLIREGKVAISLGTSDTLFGFMRAPAVDPSGTGHVFASPTGDYMSLVCFKNGSLARESIRARARLDWDGFSRALRETQPGNDGRMMLPWFDAEITPEVLVPGVRRHRLHPEDGPANVRAVVEAQMMAMANHSAWMGVKVDTIHATGGASSNREILQVMADVFDADVYQLEIGNSACLGAALRAWHADELAEGRTVPWDEIVAEFVQPAPGAAVHPCPRSVQIYVDLKRLYAECEARALEAP
jgi:xylulokinase